MSHIENVWQITKEGEKKFFIISFSALSLVMFVPIGVLIYFTDPSSLLLFIIMAVVFPFLIIGPLFHIESTSGGWSAPTLIKINDDEGYVLRKEEFPDGFVREVRVYFDSIYRIEIKSNKDARIYYSQNGMKYMWRIVRRDLTKIDREKAFQILSEIMKRIDNDKVEIIDLRKK